ncbi:MAG: TonB-dependent receptor [Pseudomonadota bacterium]|nr:TonB-dependent receptor [Pseudomonadota bacterium]
MKEKGRLKAHSALGVLAAGLMFGIAAPAAAQVAQSTKVDAEESLETAEEPTQEAEIVVTGTLIRGTSELAALPVDVVSAEEIANQGSPTVLELMRRLPAASGVLGEQNQFDARAQGSEGVVSVNLRGLGPGRTLVLLNGRRLALAPIGVPSVDVSLLPVAALGRLEVLRDGGAATYGSDALAGVVNFITNSRLQGLVVGGDYKWYEGSDGEYSASVAFGHNNRNGFRVLGSIGWQHRSPLPVLEREFTQRPFAVNPGGGFTLGGNPSVFVPFRIGPPGTGATAGLQLDRGCQPLGGTVTVVSGVQRCAGQFTPFDLLVEDEDRFQFYLESGVDLTDGMELTLTGLIGHSNVESNTSPTFLVLNTPSRLANPIGAQFFVPANNPGLAAYRAANPGQFPGGATNALLAAGTFRTALLGGNPLFSNVNGVPGAGPVERWSESARFSAVLGGGLTDGLNYELGLTYHEYTRRSTQLDTVVDRLQLALRGFGGENCNRAANTPGQNGCLFFNPFSNAIPRNPITGQTNPGFNPAVANSNEVFEYFLKPSFSRLTNEILVADALVSGQTGITLAGGAVGFAVGAQYRKEDARGRYGIFNNRNLNPCPGSLDFGDRNCVQQTGLFGFLGSSSDYDTDGDVRAAFAELQIPVLETLNVQLAARYEDFGGRVGSTFDPQARARWQVTPWLALRGGVGTTFRAPPITIIQPNDFVTSLQFVGGSFRAVVVQDNPNLTPEKALNYSAGIVLEVGGFRGTVDYFRYDLEDQLVVEPVAGLRRAVFGNTDAASALANCSSPFIGRFTFNQACVQGTTNLGNVTRVTTSFINGPELQNSGVDILGDYSFEVGQARMMVGGSGTYVIDYKNGDLLTDGILLQPGFNAVGKLNFQTTAYPLPRIKGQGYIQGELGPHHLRATVNYVHRYNDQRFEATPDIPGARINSFTTVDLAYRLNLWERTDITLAAFNIFNEEPPFARLDFNYDPFTASPVGRQLKVGVSTRF